MLRLPSATADGAHGTGARARQLPLALLLGLLLVLAAALAGCAKKAPAPADPGVTLGETPEAFVAKLDPKAQELSSWNELAPTLRKSIDYVAKKKPDGLAVSRPGLKVTWGELDDSLKLLRALLPELDKKPALLTENFRWVPVEEGIQYSGYYEPTVKASRKKTGRHTQAIYKLPPDFAKVRAKGPYHSRKEIDGPKQVLAGKGLELAWADPVDVYFLQIQGSGKLLFDDGTTAYLNYAGQNGRKYRASGRIMKEKGYPLKRFDIFEQRKWFKEHPETMEAVFFENPSYVFFSFSTRSAIGAIGHTVDDWVSLATDRRFLPLGGIVAYGVNIPDKKAGKTPLRGIGLAQDTGGAIKRNRIDVYCGGSERSNYVASYLDAKGPAWLLLKKPGAKAPEKKAAAAPPMNDPK